ncbi:MAG: MotA/TolQ/ExbB proton channel family protein [Rhodospirillales bacterium]|nr:MAG: MotA/TolQ/ExbB proton channel family protein [Rhodospirillales bacterium]
MAVSSELEQARARRPESASRSAAFLASVANRDSGSRGIAASQLKLVLSNRISVVYHMSNSLVLLGLVGTVVGFIIALSGVDPEAAGDVDSIAPMVAELIHGMSVALYTTLVGAVLHLWLKINYLMLSGGTVRLLDRLVARAEANARG